jgi:hypothetical protein
VALAIRLFVILLLHAIIDQRLFALDDDTYSGMASQAASGDTSSWDDFTRGLYNQTFTFTGLLTVIYKLFGPVAVLGQIMVAIVGSATAAAVAKLGARISTAGWGLAAGLVIAFLPSQVIWSSLLLKNPFVWAVLATLGLTIAAGRDATQHRWIASLVGLAALLTGLAYLRNHTLVVAVGALCGASLVAARSKGMTRVAAPVLIAVCVPLAVGLGPAGKSVVTSAGSLEARRIANAQGANTGFVEPTPTSAAPSPGPPVAPPHVIAAAEANVKNRSTTVVALVSAVEAAQQELETAPPDDKATLRRKRQELAPVADVSVDDHEPVPGSVD